jgi:hypothetical protein
VSPHREQRQATTIMPDFRPKAGASLDNDASPFFPTDVVPGLAQIFWVALSCDHFPRPASRQPLPRAARFQVSAARPTVRRHNGGGDVDAEGLMIARLPEMRVCDDLIRNQFDR